MLMGFTKQSAGKSGFVEVIVCTDALFMVGYKTVRVCMWRRLRSAAWLHYDKCERSASVLITFHLFK